MSYRNLEIWQLARTLVVDVHQMTLKKLPKCDETTDHLETLFETESLTDRKLYDELHTGLELLGKKLNLFTQSVERSHISEK